MQYKNFRAFHSAWRRGDSRRMLEVVFLNSDTKKALEYKVIVALFAGGDGEAWIRDYARNRRGISFRRNSLELCYKDVVGVARDIEYSTEGNSTFVKNMLSKYCLSGLKRMRLHGD